jgi:hypothetical protein
VTSIASAGTQHERAPGLLVTELVAGAFLCAARIVLVLMVNAYVHHWDTISYQQAAQKPLVGLLFDSWRAPTYPFLLKLLRYHEESLIVLQAILASVSWLFFAFTLASFFGDRRIRLTAFASFYLLSFSVPILQWDYVLYAESVSLSLFALVASFLLRYVDTGKLADLRWLIVLAVPFVLARDSNVLAFAVVALFALLRNRTPSSVSRPSAVKLALVLAAVALLPIASVALSGRGSTSIENVILKGIATQPAFVDEMVARYGMPRSAIECAGQFTWNCDQARLEELDAWVIRSGRNSYFRFLLAHPISPAAS